MATVVKVMHPGNRPVHYHVLDFKTLNANQNWQVGIVATTNKNDHNGIRRAFALIRRVLGKSVQVYDFMLAECDGRWHIVVYINNWPGRAAYYAGQITGYLKALRRTANKGHKTTIGF